MSQMDAIVEIKAKVPVTIHPTYARSQWNIAQRRDIALHGVLKIPISSNHEETEVRLSRTLELKVSVVIQRWSIPRGFLGITSSVDEPALLLDSF